jgi:S-adenosylmethionine synthetase
VQPKHISINQNYLFTSESVSNGHPDKICDQISDRILDLYLAKNSQARVAVETMVMPHKVVLAGEVSDLDAISKEILEQEVRNCIKEIGYEQKMFHWQKVIVENNLIGQSPDIAMGVVAYNNKEEGAGDQGIMFGYACNETEALMPAPIHFAHRILHDISEAIYAGQLKGLGPDAKSQVTLEYVNGKPIKAKYIVVSIQHHQDLNQQQVKDLIRPYVIKSLPDHSWMCPEENFYVNATGRFVIGGPESDTGVTGRKIIVDTYGGAAPHGGGAFSGKDPSKVDRSAAYAVRYLAKNIVAAGLAQKCTIQISYVIGISKPLSFYVDTHQTGVIPDSELSKVIEHAIDLSPRGIRNHLKLDNPIYKPTATYGHFGRNTGKDGTFTWEKTDLVDHLLKTIK